jgi:hypothetical protein
VSNWGISHNIPSEFAADMSKDMQGHTLNN